jgi:hypothetical protein
MSIPAQKLAYSQGTGTMARTHQDDIALAATDERQPPQDERPHENLAQLGVFGDQQPQAISTNLKKLTRLSNAASHQTALPGDHGDLAGKLSGAVGHDWALARQIRLHNFHAARKQNEKRDPGIVGLEQDFAWLNLSQLATGTDTTDLRRSQDWKRLGAGVEHTRSGPSRHRFSHQLESRRG